MRLAQPRIEPVKKEAWTEAQQAVFGPIDRAGRLYNVHATMANHPELARDWLVFASHILMRNSLPARDREILILRIGCLCRADYELAQHARIGKRNGLTDEDLKRISQGPGMDHFSTFHPYPACYGASPALRTANPVKLK